MSPIFTGQLRLRSRKVGQFWADMVIEDVALHELKAARTLKHPHDSQLGMLLSVALRPQLRRLLFDSGKKMTLENPRKSAAQVCA